jgi:hypothetical protein
VLGCLFYVLSIEECFDRTKQASDEPLNMDLLMTLLMNLLHTLPCFPTTLQLDIRPVCALCTPYLLWATEDQEGQKGGKRRTENENKRMKKKKKNQKSAKKKKIDSYPRCTAFIPGQPFILFCFLSSILGA